MDKEALMELIANNLRECRRNTGLSQEKIAAEVGISTSHYAALENSRKLMSTPVLLQLSDILKVSTDYILKGRRAEYVIKNMGQLLENQPAGIVESVERIVRLYIEEFTAGRKDLLS